MSAGLLALHKRQHLSGGILQQAMGDDLLLSIPACQKYPGLDWILCNSRPVESSGSGHQYRVVSPSPSDSENFQIMGDAGDQLLFSPEQQISCILLSSPGPSNWAGRYVHYSVGHIRPIGLSPFSLIRMVINWVMTFRCIRMTMLAPCWPHFEWFPDLLRFSVDVLRKIPLWPSLLRQPQSRRFH